MRVIYDHSAKVAENIFSFYFKPPSRLRYMAGQFIEIRVPHPVKDKRTDKRWFTLSSSPTEELLTITTKFAPEKSSSFKTALRALKPGTELHMAAPMGDFVLPKDATIPLFFVAGGIGCTPFRSMIKCLQDKRENREINMVYAASSDKEVAFKPIFNSLGKNFQPYIKDRLTAEKILEMSGNNKDQYIYLSGPEPMVEALDKDLKKSGINKKNLRTDFFPGYVSI